MDEKLNETEAPRGLITPEQAKALDEAYNSRHEAVSKFLGKPDNRSTWYSLDEIKKFLAYAEKQAEELGYTFDGIRVYEGAHKEDNLTTMFLIPTGTKKSSEKSQDNIAYKAAAAPSGDVPGGGGLNMGTAGDPPAANYPQ
ncbi:hypothetical protein [Formosa sp. A9]|uniref:hypothetical protein n=1 Tax=Formosa sp. A9 TaxID=3442641 RepID=UPI003EBB2292